LWYNVENKGYQRKTKGGIMFKKIVIGISIIALLIGSAFALGLLDLGWMKFFGVRKENIRREIFEQTKSYNQAKLQELAKYKAEYDRGTEGDKTALKSVMRHKFADYDVSKLPYQLKVFVEEMRGY